VSRGIASQLGKQKIGRNAGKLMTEVITRFNVPSNVVTQESQAASLELKESQNDV
jgi:hypothetical protein